MALEGGFAAGTAGFELEAGAGGRMMRSSVTGFSRPRIKENTMNAVNNANITVAVTGNLERRLRRIGSDGKGTGRCMRNLLMDVRRGASNKRK
jgi:hypothetical protein